MDKFIIVITGATATGKSAFSVDLAKAVRGEIINADIGSFYEPLTIGTAKPDWQYSEIAHHLFDELKEPVNFTVVQFRSRVMELCGDIWSRGNVPIVVGGSAFYIKALFYRQHNIEGTQDVVKELEQQVTISSEELWSQLNFVDPKRALLIDSHDRYRIIRALAIFKATGQKPSDFDQILEPIAPFYFINCVMARAELYERINTRVLVMLQMGWRHEVDSLRGTPWENFLQKKKMIGYDDLLDAAPYGEVSSIIAQKTRNYAKRQITFLNKLVLQLKEATSSKLYVGSVGEINLTLCDVGLYINGLLKQILKQS